MGKISYRAIAKDDLGLEDNPHEKWIKGKEYLLVDTGDRLILSSESGFATYYVRTAFEKLKDVFDLEIIK